MAKPDENKVKLDKNGNPVTGGAAMKKRRGWKDHLKPHWIKAYRQLGTIGLACDAVNVSREQARDWRKEDPEFKKQFEEANIRITELIERSALNRAIYGVKEPIYQGGQKVGEVQRPSDTLAIFMLKARAAKKYRWYKPNAADAKFINALVEGIAGVIQKNIPQSCPHCSNLLSLKPAILRDLTELSKKLEGQVPK